MMMVVWWLFLLAIGVGVVALIEVSVLLVGSGTVVLVDLRALGLWFLLA